jgi:uncharacterized protein
MSRVVFDNQPSTPQFDRTRADVACFVGLVRLLPGATVPAGVSTWLTYLGYPVIQIKQIVNIPVPIETYAGFASIFDDGSAGTGFGTDYLGATVRSFFAQGGKKCYVVRIGDPVMAKDDLIAKLQKLLPSGVYAPDNPETWTGVGSLGVLEDVSFLVTPDLPILCASAPTGALGQLPVVPTGPEEFVVCSQGDITPRQYRTFPSSAPRLATNDYDSWAASISVILNYLASGTRLNQLHLREIQYVASFPLPQNLDSAAAAENPSSAEIAQDIHNVVITQMPEVEFPVVFPPNSNISSRFLQLVYPWLKTSGSNVLLELLEPPDGALVGLLARNALTRGTFTSATKVTPAEIYDVSPALPAQEMRSAKQPLVWLSPPAPAQPKALIERLSLFGFTPAGLRLLSDVTTYPGESYRSGPVSRLVQVICRSARRMGESVIFESNGPALWGRVQRVLQNLMTRLWSQNALNGASVADAFSVRCDQTTMTQNDLDNGRLMALLTFTAASTVETISVKLAMEASGTSAQQITANLAEAS